MGRRIRSEIGGRRKPWRFWVATVERGSPYHLVRRQPTHQGADVAIFKRPLGPKGDLYGLFAVGRHGGTRVANMGEMEDPPGSKPPVRSTPGGFAYWYIWGAIYDSN